MRDQVLDPHPGQTPHPRKLGSREWVSQRGRGANTLLLEAWSPLPSPLVGGSGWKREVWTAALGPSGVPGAPAGAPAVPAPTEASTHVWGFAALQPCNDSTATPTPPHPRRGQLAPAETCSPSAGLRGGAPQPSSPFSQSGLTVVPQQDGARPFGGRPQKPPSNAAVDSVEG